MNRTPSRQMNYQFLPSLAAKPTKKRDCEFEIDGFRCAQPILLTLFSLRELVAPILAAADQRARGEYEQQRAERQQRGRDRPLIHVEEDPPAAIRHDQR